jgi:succinyl-diaminopimelate desuccinylase
MGVNAVHRVAPVLAAAAAYQERRPVIDGCEYREALQAVRVEGGVANNVVPDEVKVTLNHRFAPDRDVHEAFAALADYLGPALDPKSGDEIVLEDHSAPAPPGLGHPVLAELARLSGTAPRAKLGWTDVSFFAAAGMAATNFGPGDPELAHTAEERVGLEELVAAHRALEALISSP